MMRKVSMTDIEEYIAEVRSDAYILEMLSSVELNADFVNSPNFNVWVCSFIKAVEVLKSDSTMLHDIFYSIGGE